MLHVDTLPDFGGALGQRDSELMISFLTVPYLRIPLVMNFFATEDRIHSLKYKAMRQLMASVLFEPGRYLPTGACWRSNCPRMLNCPSVLDREARMPKEVPTLESKLIATTYGLLLNELQRSPEQILSSVISLLKLALDLDTGTVFSTTREVVLYVIYTAAKVENALVFLLQASQKNVELQVRFVICARLIIL